MPASPSAPLRVRISVAVEVDVAAWCEEYGCAPSEVREDVQRYVRAQIDDSPAPMEVAS